MLGLAREPFPPQAALGGRSRRVTFIDWTRRRALVEPADSGGVARWTGGVVTGLSYASARAMRQVLLGADPPVTLTRRAQTVLADWREDQAPGVVHPGGTLVTKAGAGIRWWTWAGYRADATLAATLSSAAWREARTGATLVLPEVDRRSSGEPRLCRATKNAARIDLQPVAAAPFGGRSWAHHHLRRSDRCWYCMAARSSTGRAATR